MLSTIADFEDELIDRTRGLLDLVNISAAPEDDPSPRAYMKSPIGFAIRKAGGTVASFRSPSDADLATVADAAGRDDKLADLAELRLIDNCLGHWTEPDQSEGPLTQGLGKLAQFYFDRAECLREKVKDEHGVGAEVTQVGDDGLGGFSGGGTAGSSVLSSL